MSIEDIEQMMTVEEVAAKLRLSKAWVYDHSNGRRRPLLPSTKMGKSVRFRPSDVRAFVEEMSKFAKGSSRA
jgi:excisionase family DNA binding protein